MIKIGVQKRSGKSPHGALINHLDPAHPLTTVKIHSPAEQMYFYMIADESRTHVQNHISADFSIDCRVQRSGFCLHKRTFLFFLEHEYFKLYLCCICIVFVMKYGATSEMSDSTVTQWGEKCRRICNICHQRYFSLYPCCICICICVCVCIRICI